MGCKTQSLNNMWNSAEDGPQQQVLLMEAQNRSEFGINNNMKAWIHGINGSDWCCWNSGGGGGGVPAKHGLNAAASESLLIISNPLR